MNAVPPPTEPDEGRYPPHVQSHEIGRRTYIVADVQPLDVNGVRTTGFGALIWLAAFLLLLPFYSTLEANGRLWWLWTTLAGFGLGVFGWDFCRRRARRDVDGPPSD